jgi:hypothetical protein
MNVLLAGNILQIVNQLPKYQNNDDLVSELWWLTKVCVTNMDNDHLS